MPRLFVGAAAYLLLFAGCAHTSWTTWKIDKPENMRSVLLQHIPPGTPLESARRFMAAEGFDCKIRRNEEFTEQTQLVKRGETHKGIDFLECHRAQNAGHLLMTHVWTVAVVLDGDSVKDVLVDYYLDGP